MVGSQERQVNRIDDLSGKKIAIVGVGNILLKDEGVGIRAVQRLRDYRPLPSQVILIDAGLPGLELLDLLQDASLVVIVDAARMDKPPGSVCRFGLNDVEAKKYQVGLSSHNLGVMEILQLARAMGRSLPEVVFIGVEPKELSWGTELSPEVESSLDYVVKMIWAEISLGTG